MPQANSGSITRRRMLSALARFSGTMFAGLPILNDPAATNWQLNPLASPVPTVFPLIQPVPLLPNANVRTTKAISTLHFALGSDRFVAEEWRALEGRRVGLITNQTGMLSDGRSLLSAIAANPHIHLKALFAPEHGLHGMHKAGALVGRSYDPLSHVPVYSLYGANRKPTPEMLSGIDVLLFDIQDVGARTYTYISTLALVMQAAAEHGKSVWVLDRPNPIGGSIIESPVLERRYASFIGLYPLPMRHGLTVGEIATLYQHYFGIRCDLQVIRMSGYTRRMYWPDTKLHWIPTSPNIPHFRTAMLYLTTGPLGACGLLNGIGSAQPFEVVVAPGLDGHALAERLNERHLPGVHFTPTVCNPQQGGGAGGRLGGIKITVTHHPTYLAVHTGVEILAAISHLAPGNLHFTSQFDRDWGTASLRKGLRTQTSLAALAAQWQPRLDAFAHHRKAALLYT